MNYTQIGSMKAKHHFLIHYPTFMELMGPISKLNTIKYKRIHPESKCTANVSLSRVKITKNLALKHQLVMNYRLTKYLNHEAAADVVCGPPVLSLNSFFPLLLYNVRAKLCVLRVAIHIPYIKQTSI